MDKLNDINAAIRSISTQCRDAGLEYLFMLLTPSEKDKEDTDLAVFADISDYNFVFSVAEYLASQDDTVEGKAGFLRAVANFLEYKANRIEGVEE